MGIYGNAFKVNQIVTLTEVQQNILNEVSEECSVYEEQVDTALQEAEVSILPKFKQRADVKNVYSDIKKAKDILKAEGESVDVNKVGKALLNILDKAVNILSVAGTLSFGPVGSVIGYIGSRLIDSAIRSAQENQAKKYATEAINKLSAIKDQMDDESKKAQVQDKIDKLTKDLERLDMSEKEAKLDRKKEKNIEKAAAKEVRAEKRAAKKEARAEKKAAKRALKDARTAEKLAAAKERKEKLKEDYDMTKDYETLSNMYDFMQEQGIELSDTFANTLIEAGILEEAETVDDKSDLNAIYTKTIEQFMEAGVQLSPDNMEALKVKIGLINPVQESMDYLVEFMSEYLEADLTENQIEKMVENGVLDSYAESMMFTEGGYEKFRQHIDNIRGSIDHAVDKGLAKADKAVAGAKEKVATNPYLNIAGQAIGAAKQVADENKAVRTEEREKKKAAAEEARGNREVQAALAKKEREAKKAQNQQERAAKKQERVENREAKKKAREEARAAKKAEKEAKQAGSAE